MQRRQLADQNTGLLALQTHPPYGSATYTVALCVFSAPRFLRTDGRDPFVTG